MNLVLISSEEADRRSLMHYRTPGSKNGERRYQREDGSLTPLGYLHYKAMYGWGKHTAKTPAEKAEVKAAEAELKAEQKRIKAERAQEREQKANRTDKEIEADVKAKIQAINDKAEAARSKPLTEKQEALIKNASDNGTPAAKLAEQFDVPVSQITKIRNDEKTTTTDKNRPVVGIDEKGKEQEVKRLSLGDQTKLAIVDKEQLQEQKEEIKKARDMSDSELQQAINRLQKEKQYSELLNERANREKGPIRQMASKLLQDAAQDLARKALGVAVDKIIDKAREKAAFKLADFKDVDPYSLPSDKLKAVANAFNDAANLARNRNVVNNGGLDPNQKDKNSDNNSNNNNQKQNNNGNNQKQSNGGSDQKQESKASSETQSTTNENRGVSKNQRKKMRAMASSGQSAAEIAKQMGVSESTVRQYAGEQLKKESEQAAPAPAPVQTKSSSSASKSDTSVKKEPAKEKRKDQIDLSTVKMPERKAGESMADYWDNLLRANGAKTKAPTSPKGTVSYLPLAEVKTPVRKENESMADYWERLVSENRKHIKTTSQR